MTKIFSSGSLFGHAIQQVNLSIFPQALINTAHQTQLTFDLNPWSLLFVPDKAT